MFRFIDEKNKSIRLLKGGLDSKTQYAVNRFERRNMSTSKLHVKIRNTHSHLSLHACSHMRKTLSNTNVANGSSNKRNRPLHIKYV